MLTIRPKLMVVDDDAEVCLLISALLKNEADVRTAGNATDALALMREMPPDLLLLDDKMPGALSGLEMLERMQKEESLKKIPVVMLTASDTSQQVIRGLAAGAVDYIVKPFDPKQLAEKVRNRLIRSAFTVLIGEDDTTVRELLDYKFKKEGCRTLVAANGIDVLKEMQTHTPDLVLLDRMMPGEDGITVLQKMRITPRLVKVPVVFLTAKHSASDILEGLSLGAADYIVKPFNPDEVVLRCMRLLHKNNAGQ